MSASAATTMRIAYGLIADALTAHFDGDMVRYEQVIEQVTGESDLSVCVLSTMVGMLRARGLSAATVRATARDVLGPEPAPPPTAPPAAAGDGGTRPREPAEAAGVGSRRAGHETSARTAPRRR